MGYIHNFKNFSTEYYNNFKESDFPKKMVFSKPFDIEYKLNGIIPGSNKIFLKYEMSSKQPGNNNPYSGDISDSISIDIGITYMEEGNTKIYVTLVGGNRNWWSFSYENKEIKDIEVSEYKLKKSSKNALLKALKKYSK